METLLQSLLSAVQAGDESQCLSLSRQLAECGSQILPALEKLLHAADPELRWWAVYALGQAGLPQSTALLIDALQDAEPAVRHCAARALQEQADPLAVPTLVGLLGQADGLLKRLAADALIAAGVPAISPLLEIMQDQNHPGRGQAVRILALIADPSAIPVLFAALEDESDWVKYWANEGLERMGIGMVFFKP